MRALLLAGALALASGASAGVVAVYAPASGNVDADLEALRAAALQGGPAPEGFTLRVSESCSLSSAFTVPPGTVAYFLADGSLEMLPGFEMLGESVLFESVPSGTDTAGDGLGKHAIAVEGVTRAFPTSLRAASWEAGALRLGYALSAPARVTLEVYTASGRVLASREWREASAGAFERRFVLPRAAEPVFVRWTAGRVGAIRKVRPGAPSGMR